MKFSSYAAVRSDVDGIVWPPISGGLAASLVAALRQLDTTQWLPPNVIAAHQFQQLGRLAEHCECHSPFFRERLKKAGLKPADIASPEGLRRLPVMRRREFQSRKDLYCDKVPRGHDPVTEAHTSGSTGQPVCVHRTQIGGFDWFAYTLRSHFWHGRDFRERFCSIRANLTTVGEAPDWGKPVNILFDSGPGLAIPISTAIEEQVRLIRDFAPDGLLVYPSNLAALLRHWEENSRPPRLTNIRTIAETLSPALREDARRVLGVEIEDCYSSQEGGTIALQCPDAPCYHVMETIIVEILDDDGLPCLPGKMGRVTLTDLHNFATPIIRYELGDYAEAGSRCSCGRGLPVLRRILGRERNLVLLPDGSRHWPIVGIHHFEEVAPVTQFQFRQTGRETIEGSLAVRRPLTAGEEEAFKALVRESLGYPFDLKFTYFEGELPRGPNGKFEEFVCLVS